jgi:hypothetical protein
MVQTRDSEVGVSSSWLEIQELVDVGSLCVDVSHENLPAHPSKDPTCDREGSKKECNVNSCHRYSITVRRSFSANNTNKFGCPVSRMGTKRSYKTPGLGTPRV